MSLKDDVELVKNELSNEDKIFEGSVKIERFFIKYKKVLLGFVVVLIGSVIVNELLDYNNTQRLNNINGLYSQALKNDKNSLEKLKVEAPKLWAIANYQLAKESSDKPLLESVANSNVEFVSSLAKYELAINKKDLKELDEINLNKDALIKDFSKLNQAILLYKDKKFKESESTVDSITSKELENLTKVLKHALVSKI